MARRYTEAEAVSGRRGVRAAIQSLPHRTGNPAASCGSGVPAAIRRGQRPRYGAGDGAPNGSRRLVAAVCAALALMLCSALAGAADTPYNFEDPARQEQYLRLIAELRCLVCQNQSLADSHADLAQDLRDEVYRMVAAGRSDEEIVGFLVARYGDFVLYRPPVNALTFLLWFGPGLLVAVAGVAWWRLSRRRTPAAAAPLAPEERVALDALLDDERDAR